MTRPPPSSESSSQKTWAVVAGAAGLVVTGVGLGFGLSASSQWNEAENACPGRTCRDPADQSLGKDAGTAADVSTVLVSVGVVAIVAGVVLWLTAPTNEPRQAFRTVPTRTAGTLGFAFGGGL